MVWVFCLKCVRYPEQFLHVQHVELNFCYLFSSVDRVGSPTQVQLSSAERTLTKSLDCLGLAPPTYLVGLDVLKADLQSCKSILSHEYSQLWVKCFSLTFVLSSQLPTDLPFDGPLFHGANARVEVQGGWNRQSLYFQSRNGSSVCRIILLFSNNAWVWGIKTGEEKLIFTYLYNAFGKS